MPTVSIHCAEHLLSGLSISERTDALGQRFVNIYVDLPLQRREREAAAGLNNEFDAAGADKLDFVNDRKPAEILVSDALAGCGGDLSNFHGDSFQ